jgi:hypothetical protein
VPGGQQIVSLVSNLVDVFSRARRPQATTPFESPNDEAVADLQPESMTVPPIEDRKAVLKPCQPRLLWLARLPCDKSLIRQAVNYF